MLKRSAALGAAALLGGAALWFGVRSPGVALLPPVQGGEWIAGPEPMNLQTWAYRDFFQNFRKRFSVAEAPSSAVLTLYFMKDAAVRLDGRVILAPTRGLGSWKTPKSLDLAPDLKPGEHELLVTVLDKGGPPLMAASCPALGLASGADWEASSDLKHWAKARRAREFRRHPIALGFPSAREAFVSVLPLLVVFGLMGSLPVGPARLRWLLLGAAALLAINNLAKIPAGIGMDVSDHLDYIRYVAQNRRLPLASEGWQMFQAPLYYMLSAPFFLLFSAFGDGAYCEKALRMIPLACWLGQIEISFRFMRLVFPSRPDLQSAGTLIGGLLPMNIYVSQAVGNEPLAAFLSASAVYLGARLVDKEKAGDGHYLRLGVVVGLAQLTKMSAFLLVLPLVWLLAKARPRRRLLLAASAAFLVAGWFYIRNQVELGRPFVSGWDPSRGIAWWQDPGYRSLREFFSFGEALRHPIYSGLNGFWDSLYSTLWLDGNLSGITTFRSRPPWNYSLMISGAWLALLPSAAILLGLFRASSPRASRTLRFSLFCVFLYVAAMLALYLKLPIYSTGKATYMSGLTPCLALLAAAGLETMTRRSWAKRLVFAGLGCWAFSAYFSYWAL